MLPELEHPPQRTKSNSRYFPMDHHLPQEQSFCSMFLLLFRFIFVFSIVGSLQIKKKNSLKNPVQLADFIDFCSVFEEDCLSEMLSFRSRSRWCLYLYFFLNPSIDVVFTHTKSFITSWEKFLNNFFWKIYIFR